MVNDDKNNCIDVSNIITNDYYLNSEKTMYYSCNNNLYQDIQNCKECSSKNSCTLCQNNFTFINGDKSICILKETLVGKYIQDPLDQSNFIKCENKYKNCEACNNSQCLSCKNGYIFINEEYSECILKSSIDINFYFTNDNITYYSCKEEKYHDREECKDIIIEPFDLEILQVLIVNKKLKVFSRVSKNVEKNFHIKLSINLYKLNQNINNLQGSGYKEDYKVDLYLNNDNEIEAGKIIELTSQEEFDDNDRIIVREKQNNDYYGLKFLNNDNKVLDTQENKEMIEKNEIVDFSKIPSDYSINEYYIESSNKGCNFDLVSKTQIKEKNQDISLKFIEKNNKNNEINAKCTISSDNEKKIPCSLEQEIDNQIYILNSYIGSNEKGIYFITQDDYELQLECKEEKSNKKKIGIIVGIVVGFVVIIVVISVIVIYYKKNKNAKKKENQNISVYRTIPFNTNSSSRISKGRKGKKKSKS